VEVLGAVVDAGEWAGFATAGAEEIDGVLTTTTGQEQPLKDNISKISAMPINNLPFMLFPS
jgi:hypothetical protein